MKKLILLVALLIGMISFAQQELRVDSVDVYMPEVRNFAKHFVDSEGFFDVHQFRVMYQKSYVGTLRDSTKAFRELDSMAIERNTQTFYVIKMFNDKRIIGTIIGQEEESPKKKKGKF